MSISFGLIAFGVRCVLAESIENLPLEKMARVIEDRIKDHSQAITKALAKANDRAWQAVGLALTGEDRFFESIKDLFRDGDMRGIRDQIKKFLDYTPTGLEGITPAIRVQAVKEWHRLRKGNRWAVEGISSTELAEKATQLKRYGDLSQLALLAHQAVKEIASSLEKDTPNLAMILTMAPANGNPLLAIAFGFFFRREVEKNEELARGLTFDFLKKLGEQQEHGFQELAVSLESHTDSVISHLDGLFDAIGDWFLSADTRLGEINAKLDQLIKLRDVSTLPSEPLKVSVTNKEELELILRLRDQLRQLPPGIVATADWAKLGDTLAAAGLFPDAKEAHESASAVARNAKDIKAEAESEYKRFRDYCELGEQDNALTALQRAIELDSDRFRPFDLHRYKLQAVVGIGGFGTVFLAEDQYHYTRVGNERKPKKVAIKTFHDSGWDSILDRNLAETFDEADTLTALNHSGIVQSLNRGFGDPVQLKRAYVVLEYFPGKSLEKWLKTNGVFPLTDMLEIAKKIAEAVHAAHQQGILHRDIKPGNILVAWDESSQTWQVKVIDFGLAVKLNVAHTSIKVPSGRRAVLDRQLAGTIRYAPPEQRNELDADVGPYSDVYAWGKTCLDLLFGTTEPKSIHWKKLLPEYRESVQELLELATMDDLNFRFGNFEPILAYFSHARQDSLSFNQSSGKWSDKKDENVPIQMKRVIPVTDPVTNHTKQSKIIEPSVSVSEEPSFDLTALDFRSTILDSKSTDQKPVEKYQDPEPIIGKKIPGQIITFQLNNSELRRGAGEIMNLKIPDKEQGIKAGTITTLHWKMVREQKDSNL